MALSLRSGVILAIAAGVGVGLGVAVMAPSLFPRTARAARPLARRAVREGLDAYLRAREGLAEFGEFADDLLAEVGQEAKSARGAATVAVAGVAKSATNGAGSGADAESPSDTAGMTEH